MYRSSALLIAPAVLVAALAAAPLPSQTPPQVFLVNETGLVLLKANGTEQERLEPYTVNGALSSDGRWLAGVQPGAQGARGRLIIRPRVGRGEAASIPLIWGHTGSGCLPVWSADSKQILIGETGRGKDGAEATVVRVYNLGTKQLTDLKVPPKYSVTGWSPDGKRLLTTAYGGDRYVRIAWVNLDGTGPPDFLTSEDEAAHGARLSPDGRRILYLAGPRVPMGERRRERLYVLDLATEKRIAVDEPGHTHGYCWSPDGTRIAYTWQRPLPRPADVIERQTFLITCDADGDNRSIVTKRTYVVPENSSGRDGVIFFFEVLACH